MVTTADELEERVQAALEDERDARLRTVEALLAEHDQIEGWERIAASPELRAMLAARRAEVSVRLAESLSTWRRAGGGLALSVPPPPRVEVVAAPEPVPAEPVAVVVAPPPEPPPKPPIAVIVPEPAPRVRPLAPPASTVALAGLKEHIEKGGAFSTPNLADDWQITLAHYLRDLVPGRSPDSDLEAALAITTRTDAWYGLPAEVQRALAGLVAARLRSLQEKSFPDDRRIAFAFGVLGAFMKRARPGFVSGLSRSHRPGRGSWEADADTFFERLHDMLPAEVEEAPNVQRKLEGLESLVRELGSAPEEARSAVAAQIRRDAAAVLAAGLSGRNPRLVRILAPALAELESPELRVLRRAIREDQDAAGDDEREQDVSPLPPDWAWWGRTRGRRAVIVGGNPREPNRVRLQTAFAFAELEWMPAEFRRNSLQTVRDRVKAGALDLVILLRSFVGHDADQIILPACREHEVGWVSVEQGYGVVRVRQGIERFLDPE